MEYTLQHHGVKGQKWGRRKAKYQKKYGVGKNARQTARRLNRAAKKEALIRGQNKILSGTIKPALNNIKYLHDMENAIKINKEHSTLLSEIMSDTYKQARKTGQVIIAEHRNRLASMYPYYTTVESLQFKAKKSKR